MKFITSSTGLVFKAQFKQLLLIKFLAGAPARHVQKIRTSNNSLLLSLLAFSSTSSLSLPRISFYFLFHSFHFISFFLFCSLFLNMCQLCLLSAGTGKYQCSGPAVYSLIHLAPAPALSHYQQWGLFSAVKSCEHNSLFPSSHCSLSLWFFFFLFPPLTLLLSQLPSRARKQEEETQQNMITSQMMTLGVHSLFLTMVIVTAFAEEPRCDSSDGGASDLNLRSKTQKFLFSSLFFFLLYLVTFCSYAHGTFLHHFPRM